jgi:hypothetical protein
MSRTLSTVVATAVVLSALTAAAGPLSKAQIPATAKWVMHVDIDRLAASQTCAVLTNNPATGKAFLNAIARYRTLLGVEPLRDLHQVTLYGEDVTGNRGVALISGNLRADTLTRSLSAYPQYRATPWGAWTLHKWRDRSSGTEMNACLYSSRLLIIGSDESGVAGALNVLSGAKPNLIKGKSKLAFPRPRDGVFFTAASRGYEGAEQDPLKAMILRNTDSATLQIGEKAGRVDAGLLLNASSPEAAQQIEQILNGLVLTAALSGDSNGLARLAGLSEVSCQDRSVGLQLQCPARDAAAALAAALLSSP